MFAFHETTRKRICRTAFIALCLAPTLATAAWIVDRRLPSRTATQAARLGALLQTKAELAGYREPRPGSMRCDQLALDDSTSGEPLVRFQGVRLHRREATWSVFVEAATVDAEHLDGLAAKVGAWLALPELQSADLRVGRLTLTLPSTTTGSTTPVFTLDDLQGRIQRDAEGVAHLQLAGRATDSPAEDKAVVRLAVQRSTAAPGAKSRASLDSSASALPIELLARLVPPLSGLDAKAVLTGSVEWTIDASGVAGVAKGRLSDVALSSLLPAGSPHAVSGRATVAVTVCRWRGARLERLEASATAEDVQASKSLVTAAIKFIYCVQTAEGVAGNGKAQTIALDRLACHFVLDHRGLNLSGDLPQSVEAPTGCLATSGNQPLLLQPPYVDIPAGAWIQFVAGPSDSWLPATEAAVRMAGRLPLP